MGFSSILWMVLAIGTAILISYISMPVIIQIADLKKLMDEPDGERKFHAGIIPTLGGIGIFASFLISFSIWGGASDLESYPFFVASLFMLFLIGIKDDILVIAPVKKLAIQVLAAVELVLAGQIYIDNFEGLLGIYQLPWWMGASVSILIIVALINSYNLIDGIDGLAGGVGIVIATVLGLWFLGAGFQVLSILSLVLAGSLIGFLYFNLHPAKIFMGDTGAMAVGFILAYLSLQFLRLNATVPDSGWHVANAPVVAIAIMIIPVIDTLRVTVLRLLAGQSPFTADHNHTHHKLIEYGIYPQHAAASLWIANGLIISIAFGLQSIDANLLLVIILTAGLLILPIIKWTFRNISLIPLEANSDHLVITSPGGSKTAGQQKSANKPSIATPKELTELLNERN